MAIFPQDSMVRDDPPSQKRDRTSYLALPATVFQPGQLVQLVAQDSQTSLKYATVQPTPAAASAVKLAGVVAEDWGGFGATITQTLATASTYLASFPASQGSTGRQGGLQLVPVTHIGYHPAVQVDTTTGVTVTDGIPLQSSATTAGRLQGIAIASAVAGCRVGEAALPAAGIGSSLTQAALTQASQTLTVAGAPAAGNVIGGIFQIGGSPNFPGVAQTRTVTITLTAATATSVTTAAAALVVAINADPVVGKLYSAAPVAGVITNTSTGNYPFTVYPAAGGYFQVTNSGSAFNGATVTAVTSAGATVTSSGNMASGAGFFGTIPAWVWLK